MTTLLINDTFAVIAVETRRRHGKNRIISQTDWSSCVAQCPIYDARALRQRIHDRGRGGEKKRAFAACHLIIMWTLLYKGLMLKCTQDKLLKMFIIAVIIIINYTHEQIRLLLEVNDDQSVSYIFFFSFSFLFEGYNTFKYIYIYQIRRNSLVIKLQQIHVRV